MNIQMLFNGKIVMDDIDTDCFEEALEIIGVDDFDNINEAIKEDWLTEYPNTTPYIEWVCNIDELRNMAIRWFKDEEDTSVRRRILRKLFDCKLAEDDKWDLFNNCCLSQMKLIPSKDNNFALLWYGETEDGEVIAFKDNEDSLNEEFDFINGYYKQIMGEAQEEKTMNAKLYTLGNYEEFIKDVEKEDIFPALDEQKEPSPIEIKVHDKVCHIDMCADYWNELEWFFRECSEVEEGCKASTRGNTKADLEEARKMCRDRLEDILEGWLEDTTNEFEPYDKFRAYRNFWNLCHTSTRLSDTAEAFRLDHDLRPSEVNPFYDEEWVHKVAEEFVEESLENCFEVDYDPHNDRSHLMYFGNSNTGEHVAWYYGKISLGEAEWNEDKERVIAATWEAIKK